MLLRVFYCGCDWSWHVLYTSAGLPFTNGASAISAEGAIKEEGLGREGPAARHLEGTRIFLFNGSQRQAA